MGTECAVNTSQASPRSSGGNVAAAAAIASANISTSSGWSKYWRSLTSSGAPVAHRSPRPGDVLDVLGAAGIPAPGRRGEHRRPPNSVVTHRRNRVLDIGIPVPVTEIDRQVRATAARSCSISARLIPLIGDTPPKCR